MKKFLILLFGLPALCFAASPTWENVTVTSKFYGDGSALTSLTSSQITDSTADGRAMLKAASPAAQRTLLGLGTAALSNTTAFATAAQGTKADTALQPAGNGSALTGLTKGQVGLGSVDNTSDANKPISTATQNALNLKLNASRLLGSGIVTANSSGTLGDAAFKNTGTTAGTVAAGDVTKASLDGKLDKPSGAVTGDNLVYTGTSWVAQAPRRLQVSSLTLASGVSYADVAYTGFASAPTYIGATISKGAPGDPDIFVTAVQSITSTSARINFSAPTTTANYTVKLSVGSDGDMTVGTYQPLSAKLSSLALGTADTLTISEVAGLQDAISSANTAPASSASAGVKGTRIITANYLYICVATNEWRRIPLLTFP